MAQAPSNASWRVSNACHAVDKVGAIGQIRQTRVECIKGKPEDGKEANRPGGRRATFRTRPKLRLDSLGSIFQGGLDVQQALSTDEYSSGAAAGGWSATAQSTSAKQAW